MTERERNTPLPVKKEIIDMFERLKEFQSDPKKFMKSISDSADQQRNAGPDSPED